MKNIKNIITLTCVLLGMHQLSANTFTNLVKTGLGWFGSKVDSAIAYNDKQSYMRINDLYKPVEAAQNVWTELLQNKNSIVLHVNDKGFPQEITKTDHAQHLVMNLIHLLHEGTVTFDDKKELIAFKDALYTQADRAADRVALMDLIDGMLVKVREMKDGLDFTLREKSYTQSSDGKTLLNPLMAGNIEMMKRKVPSFKRAVWARAFGVDKKAIKDKQYDKLINDDTNVQVVMHEIMKTIDSETATEQDEKAKKLKINVEIAQYACQAFDLYIKAVEVEHLLELFKSTHTTVALIDKCLRDYHTFLDQTKKVKAATEKVNGNSYLVMLNNKKDIYNVAMIQNKSIVPVKMLQKALIDGTLVDSTTTVIDKEQYKTDFAEVEQSIRALNNNSLINIIALKDELSFISCFTTQIHFNGLLNNFVGHINRLLMVAPFKQDEYEKSVAKLIDLVVKEENMRNPEALVDLYKNHLKEYAQYALTQKLLNQVRTMYNLTLNVTQINELLDVELDVETTYEKLMVQKEAIADNQSVEKLELHKNDIKLDTLLDNRGATFATLQNKLNATGSNFDIASAIVTAGESAEQAYSKVRRAYRELLDKAGTFADHTRAHTRTTLSAAVTRVVNRCIASSTGSKEKALEELSLLKNAFISHVKTANFTDKQCAYFTNQVTGYMDAIKASLKAQIIAAWYTHDIAWKLSAESSKGFGGRALNVLRKVTPTCGKSVTLNVIN